MAKIEGAAGAEALGPFGVQPAPRKAMEARLAERQEAEAVWDRVFGAGPGKPVKGGGE